MAVHSSFHWRRQEDAPSLTVSLNRDSAGRDYYSVTVENYTEDGADSATFYLRPEQYEAFRDNVHAVEIEDHRNER
ncbi:hypothetical protein [Anaeroselena agilis]|uniref:Uncharacterized protein n=1 Tax=Anaeroselena agilis TaxID=3063788 RepID=A0ABU3NUW9_9FIRM|nr:hypothetical protein [Selenomonadales bacterium 4137-cl]